MKYPISIILAFIVSMLSYSKVYANSQTLTTWNLYNVNNRGAYSYKKLDESMWHHCPASQSGGSCGKISLSTGSSGCTTQSVDVGVSFTATYYQTLFASASVTFSYGYSWGWEACNTRSQSVSCYPDAGYKAQSQIRLKMRWAKGHLSRSEVFGGGYKSKWGWWPGYRYTQCVYRAL